MLECHRSARAGGCPTWWRRSDLEARVPSTPKWSRARPGPPHRRGPVVLGGRTCRPQNPDERVRWRADRAARRTTDLLAWLGWCTYTLLRRAARRGSGRAVLGLVARAAHRGRGGAAPGPRGRGAPLGRRGPAAGVAGALAPALATDGVPEFMEIMVGPTGRRRSRRRDADRDRHRARAGRSPATAVRAVRAPVRAAGDGVRPGADAVPAAAGARRRRRWETRCWSRPCCRLADTS